MFGKKILLILQLPPPVHGVSTMNEIILEYLQNQAIYDLEIIPLRFAKTFDDLRRISIEKVIRFIKLYLQIKHALRSFRPDLVYFSFMPVGIGFIRDSFYLRMIKKHPVKVVLHLHNRGIYESSKKLFFNKLYHSSFQDVTLVHVSDTLIKEELRNLEIRNCKQVGISNTCRSFPEKMNDNNKKTIDVLFCSNIFPEKGYRIALDAMKILKKENNAIRLIICGQPLRKKYENEIINYIQKNNLTGSVIYKGPVFGEEKERIFKESDIFIFPSYFEEECFPLVVLEAMSAGIPVIASRIGVIPEIIEDEESGFIIQPNNPEELKSSILRLVEKEELRLSFGGKARKKFLVNYNLEKFHKGIDNIIQQAFL